MKCCDAAASEGGWESGIRNEDDQGLVAYAKEKPRSARHRIAGTSGNHAGPDAKGGIHLTIQQSFRVMIGPFLNKIRRCL